MNPRNRKDESQKLLQGFIERHAVVSSILTIAKGRGMVKTISIKLIQMLDLPPQFFADNARQTVEWWLDFANNYDHSVDYGPIRLKYFEGDVNRLEMHRHTTVGGGA